MGKAAKRIEERAAKRLSRVVGLWSASTGARVVPDGSCGLLTQVVSFPAELNIPAVEFSYVVRRRLFATLFDMTYRFTLTLDGGGECDGLPDGVELRWSAKGFSAGDHVVDVKPLLGALSCGLVESRIEALGITRLSARWSAERLCWDVGISGMVGSSTWNLLPPVFHLIEPTAADCVRGTELLRMICVALRRA